ncbi:hypothetical protein BD309DRAFT_559964 [Dichomitus squalens]|uniref:Uncharacterized protein n=1 Tax=Dichomitus squalens TaxID=114155 RepID=A0A4Q9PHD9_9APHY|nr:hypothetical protein BD309DRAFT_559964 [Dichomitus squalens]TBU53117.1 hypothetical protein BD310DRAFT_180323 [Dichomitus squalens]
MMVTMNKTLTVRRISWSHKARLAGAYPRRTIRRFFKSPETFRTYPESHGFLTLFVAFVAFSLILNDLGGTIWGWSDFESGVKICPQLTWSLYPVNVSTRFCILCSNALLHMYNVCNLYGRGAVYTVS